MWLTSTKNGSIHRIISVNCREENEEFILTALLDAELLEPPDA